MNTHELKQFLDEKVQQYKTAEFIEEDPIAIPKAFTQKQDIEIAGLLSATIAWGNRKSVIKSANTIIEMMENTPFAFVQNFNKEDLSDWKGSIHRTFFAEDLIFFIERLQSLYKKHESLEELFIPKPEEETVMNAIARFRKRFLDGEEHRAKKHISNPDKNAAAKRLNMFLRWMVRKDAVDIGIWDKIPTSQLCLPLDVHTARVGRKLGLLYRTQNDRKAVEEIMQSLSKLNAEDPVQYDFALFGLGVYEKF